MSEPLTFDEEIEKYQRIVEDADGEFQGLFSSMKHVNYTDAGSIIVGMADYENYQATLFSLSYRVATVLPKIARLSALADLAITDKWDNVYVLSSSKGNTVQLGQSTANLVVNKAKVKYENVKLLYSTCNALMKEIDKLDRLITNRLYRIDTAFKLMK